MTTSSGRIAGIAVIASFVFQVCMISPPSKSLVGSHALDQQIRRVAEVSFLVPDRAVETSSAASVPTDSISAYERELFAMLQMNLSPALQKAQALDAEAVRLLSEAASLEAETDTSFTASGPFDSIVFPSIVLLYDAALRRARANQLSSEALKLRRYVDVMRTVGGTSSVRASAGISLRDIASGGILGGSGSVIQNPLGSHSVDRIPRELGAPVDNAIKSVPERVIPGVGTVLDGSLAAKSPPDEKLSNIPDLFSKPNSPTSPPTALPPTSAMSFAAEAGKIDGLVQGSAAVSAPSTTKAGDSFSVFLRVSPEKLAVVMQALKDEFPENQTVKGKQGIKLTPRMMASVSGFGFEVSPKDGQVQAVSATEATTWPWQVKAIESGLHTLTFTLSGTLIIEGKEVARNFYQYQQKVQVEVSPMGFMEQYWQWLMTTLAIPVIGAAWAVFRKPKDGGEKRQPSLAEKLRERRRLRTIG